MTQQFDNLLSPKMHAYSKSQIDVTKSHYNDPIDKNNGRLAGNSRIVGDASSEVQHASINAIRKASEAAGLNDSETALILAIVRKESGFNPDAAAGTTSASGLGQFTKATEKDHGITDENRWNLNTQAHAIVNHYIKCHNKTVALQQDSSHIYALWHDGINSGGYGDGLDISTKDVMPYASKFQNAITNVSGYVYTQNNASFANINHPDFAGVIAQFQSTGISAAANQPTQPIDQNELMKQWQQQIDKAGFADVNNGNKATPNIRGEQQQNINTGHSI